MDTLFLETLIAVIDSGTLVDAARKLHVTPGAVAQRLRALESNIGARLVMRAGRAVRPTDAGLRLAVRARAVLRDIGDLRYIAVNDTLSGQLRLGAIATALTGMMPAILERLAGAHPQMEVFLEPGTSENLYRRVQQGELDAAVIVLPRFAVQKTLDWRGLRREPLVVIAAQALAQASGDAHALLMSHPFIRYDRNQWGGYIADRYLQHAGLAPTLRFELDALDAIAVMVDRGLGVSLVPDWAPPWPQGLTLKKVALPQPFQQREIGVVWNKGSAHITLISALLEQAGSSLP